MDYYDIVIIGGGPAGLASALEIDKHDFKQVIIERESRAGGILKQCIHDGFGVVRFKKRLTGPEYAHEFYKEVLSKNIPIWCNTFVRSITKDKKGYLINLVNEEKAMFQIHTKALILANGCRERTSRQIFIQGDRPAGVYTAGTAQYFVNILGYLPCKKCVILGSGDIGLIMARRLTLEGAEVEGVYEINSKPSGLTRNVIQCLEDYNIPLHLGKTITKIHGVDRVESVTVVDVDEFNKPINGTEQIVECDGVILSVGLIPENELAKSLDIPMDKYTKGPLTDHNLMTFLDGVFSCGNALHVNDLVDYVSESAETAARSAVRYINEINERNLVPVNYNVNDFLYIVPRFIDINNLDESIILYFRSKKERDKTRLNIYIGDKLVVRKVYNILKPSEMERVIIKAKDIEFVNKPFTIYLEDVE